MNEEKRVDEFAAGQASGKGIKLGAVTDLAEELLRLVSRNTEKGDLAPRRPQQPRHEIHDRGLAGAVRPDETGNAGADAEIDSIHSENLTVELGDVVEDYVC